VETSAATLAVGFDVLGLLPLWAGLGFDVARLFRRRLLFGYGRRGGLFALEDFDVV
jgi:hypothetical protein